MTQIRATKNMVLLAIKIARYAPKRRPRHEGHLADNTMIPWPLIEDLRSECDKLGFDWRKRG